MSAVPSVPRLLPGDRLPKLVVKDKDGQDLDLTYQLVAGRPMVLWLATAADPILRNRHAGLAARFEEVDARLFLVPVSEDQGRTIAGLLAPQGGLALLTPTWRLAKVLPETAIEEALAWCRMFFEASTDTLVPAGKTPAPVLLVENVLEPELCQRLIRYWEGQEKHKGKVADAAADAKQTVRLRFKRRDDVAIEDLDLFNTVKERLARRVLPELVRWFQARITNIEGLRIGCYDAADAGEFLRHRDNSTPFTQHRQFTVSVVLNDDYEGGWLRFPEFGRERYQPGVGGAVVFSVAMLHEVTPVTSGQRFVLVTFVFDQIGAEMERQLKARQGKSTSP
jgi:predicted 2-oxoglutarate/Fe(II)-dependent dioxygenase YbiX